MKCLICNHDKANATGSHIVPHFILKRIDNEANSSGRDKEMGFALSENFPSSYFGRATSVEKLEEIYGEVTDDLIEKNSVPLIEDHIFCLSCEKKLSVIESEYSKTIHNPSYKCSIFISFLFWTSLIWRLSIAQKSGFKLRKSNERRLRRILSKYLSIDIDDIKPNSKDHDLKNIGYQLLRCVNYSKNNSTFLFCHPDFQKPYYFVIDEFILVFHIDRYYSTNNGAKRLGLTKEMRGTSLNTPFVSEQIKKLDYEVLNRLKEYFYSELSRRFIKNFSEFLDRIHQQISKQGQNMPDELKRQIISALIMDDERDGIKYTQQHQIKVIRNEILKYVKKIKGYKDI